MFVSDSPCWSVHASLDNCRMVLIEISFNEARGPTDTTRSVKMWFAELPIRFKKTLSVSDHQVPGSSSEPFERLERSGPWNEG